MTGYLGAAVAPLAVLALLVVVLLVRPDGLFAGDGGEAGMRPPDSPLAARAAAIAVAATFVLDPYRNYQLALVAAYLCATGRPDACWSA